MSDDLLLVSENSTFLNDKVVIKKALHNVDFKSLTLKMQKLSLVENF
jgi:hypothetical protein